MSQQKVIFVTGPQWVPKVYFDKFYKPRLTALVADTNNVFTLGAADGVDSFTQQFFIDAKIEPRRVTIYNKGDKDQRLHPDFKLTNGFSSYPDRDQALYEDSDELLVFLPQMGGAQSGVMQSILLSAGVLDGADVLGYIRHVSEPFDKELMARVAQVYEDFYGPSNADEIPGLYNSEDDTVTNK